MILLCFPETVISSSLQVSMYLLLQTGSSSEYVTAVSGGLILLSLLITNIHMRHFSCKTHLNPAWLCRFSFIPTAKFFLHSGLKKTCVNPCLSRWHQLCSYWFTTHHMLQLFIPCLVQSSLCSRGHKPGDLVPVNSGIQKILECQNC